MKRIMVLIGVLCLGTAALPAQTSPEASVIYTSRSGVILTRIPDGPVTCYLAERWTMGGAMIALACLPRPVPR